MEYKCPHCLGKAKSIPGTSLAQCEGVKHCQFRAHTDEFEHIGTEASSAGFELLDACKRLLEEWDKREGEQHGFADNLSKPGLKAYRKGLGTGYGICREELRQAVEGI